MTTQKHFYTRLEVWKKPVWRSIYLEKEFGGSGCLTKEIKSLKRNQFGDLFIWKKNLEVAVV